MMPPLTAAQRRLRAALRHHQPVVAAASAYLSPADFVLREGRWYRVRVAPEFPKGAPRRCFGNAINNAVMYGLGYVEGYALTPFEQQPVHHAWNTLPNGDAVDLTWGLFEQGVQVAQVGVAYLGVEFSVERADDATWEGDATVLDDRHRGHPLLHQPWRGEPADATWPPSPRLEALRAARDGDTHAMHVWLRRAQEECA